MTPIVHTADARKPCKLKIVGRSFIDGETPRSNTREPDSWSEVRRLGKVMS